MKELQFRNKLNKEFGFNPWPNHYYVDPETYGYICQYLFDYVLDKAYPKHSGQFALEIVLGPNNGIMYKNVELILEDNNEFKNIDTKITGY